MTTYTYFPDMTRKSVAYVAKGKRIFLCFNADNYILVPADSRKKAVKLTRLVGKKNMGVHEATLSNLTELVGSTTLPVPLRVIGMGNGDKPILYEADDPRLSGFRNAVRVFAEIAKKEGFSSTNFVWMHELLGKNILERQHPVYGQEVVHYKPQPSKKTVHRLLPSMK
ncbi:MAG: hypothetical protein AB7E52_02560 [Bdellovibrionales bacterium]